jgi:hypothetical protein
MRNAEDTTPIHGEMTMLLATAQYRNTHFQTAAITIWKRQHDYYIKADIGGDSLTQPPAWSQVATTEEGARTIGNHFHRELKALYHMQRIS